MDTNTNQSTGGATDDFDECCGSGHYRRHFSATAAATATPMTRSYDAVRPAYALGHRAASSPTYAGRSFEEVEPDLRREYGEESTFDTVRDYVRQGFEWKTVVGALAVAAGGWWASRKLYEAVSQMNEEDEQDSRTFYETHPARSTGLSYERARTGYSLGYAASTNPDYSGRAFDDVETDLRGGFTAGGYDSVRDFARRGYERGSTRRSGATSGAGGTL